VSFSPLPEILLEKVGLLAGAASPVVLDLGCGEGNLGRLLGKAGVEVVGVDRFSPALGTAASVVADASRPCFLPGCCDLLLAGNLARHLLRSDRGASFLGRWADLLKPGSCLLLLEDQPDSSTPARRNYREVQEFLVTLSAGSRAPLLDRKAFAGIGEKVLKAGTWRYGLKTNRQRADVQAVTALLCGQGGAPGPVAARLIGQIEKHGIDYGPYWWACWQKDQL
jgi:SAM-dependent methyltransferase